MRRVAVLAFRTARRSAIRKLVNKSPFSTANHAVTFAQSSALVRRYSSSRQPLQASMRLPKLPIAFVGTLGAIGAWYAYNGNGTQHLLNQSSSPVSATPSRSLTTASDSAQSTESPSATSVPLSQEANRKALVVDNDQFFTGSIVGEGPLEKDTDDFGRKVLEMMTPEQATERLRKNEQSFLVGRGRGVVRYDVVQLPSNDPIEDDHAEKIVEVPSSIAATEGQNSSDWMFWGVFDGHSGWTTSAKLRQVMISFAARELNTTYKAALSNAKSPFPPLPP